MSESLLPRPTLNGVREAECVNCGWRLIENPRAGEWLHASTAERSCNSLIPGFRAKPMPWTIRAFHNEGSVDD